MDMIVGRFSRQPFVAFCLDLGSIESASERRLLKFSFAGMRRHLDGQFPSQQHWQ